MIVVGIYTITFTVVTNFVAKNGCGQNNVGFTICMEQLHMLSLRLKFCQLIVQGKILYYDLC